MPEDEASASAVSTRTVELVTALLFLLIGSVIMWDSWRIGAGWGSDGPQSGYFPFYVALLMNIASAVNFWHAAKMNSDYPFVSKPVLKLVLAIFVPCLLYVGLVQWAGLYVASTLFVAFFMRWQGKFGLLTCCLSGGVLSVLLFLMFELWFKIPLPKGPLEAALGF